MPNISYDGFLLVSVTSSIGMIPIQNATIQITYTGNSQQILSTVTTNENGQTPLLTLSAPDPEYSMNPTQNIQPYSQYNINISAPGYEPVFISGTEILPDVIALQTVKMIPAEIEKTPAPVDIFIPQHTLFGDYPPKIPEEEIKPTPESGEIVLSKVVVPEFIIVHDGAPSDTSAQNYYVRYKDYIKNVASSEIYATWPEATIYANILCIMSFTLNRVYTEWYRSRGYDFTITSSTAYDQKWINGRNTYENIDQMVDSIFANYLSRPGVLQPIFTSYCDGQKANCRGLSQWGSKYLGEEGYSAIEIIRYYYGNDMYINTADSIDGIPGSWPGYNLSIGTSGAKVQQAQEQLNRIAQNYPALPTVTPDGIYGQRTADAVKKFQQIFSLPVTGVIDYSTWYELSEIYVGVTEISEP